MTSLEPPSNRNAWIGLDSMFLMRQLPALSEVKHKRVGWNDLGARITREYQPKPPRNRPKASHPDETGSPAGECWRRAKNLLHNIMATSDPENAPVRKRLGDFKNPSTAALFSTLSLYLAGKLGLSLTITQPMLAVMLYAVHGASGNWNVLLD
jgi:hypothetical protein